MTQEEQKKKVEEILGSPLPDLDPIYIEGAKVYMKMSPNTFITPVSYTHLIESVKNLLGAAQKANTSIIAFDALDYDTIFSCIKGAEAARRPVILMLYPAMNKIMSFRSFTEVVRALAQEASVPVALHLDHCSDFNTIPVSYTHLDVYKRQL